MLQLLYTYVVSVCFNLVHLVLICLQQVLLSTRIDSRARKRCMQPVLPIFVMRASSNSRPCMQRAVNAQTAEHFLVKVYVRIQSTRAAQHTMPNGCRTKGPAPPGVPPLQCNMQPGQHMGKHIVLPLSHAAGWAPRTCSPGRRNSKRRRVFPKKSKRGRRVH
jgi:hypothetical protein